jgi:hypothetical protein
VTGGVDQVDQEVVLGDLEGNILHVIFVQQLGVEGDGSGLDGHTTLLLVGTGIREAGRSSVRCGDDTGTLNEGIGEGGFSVVDCRGGELDMCACRSAGHLGIHKWRFAYRGQ